MKTTAIAKTNTMVQITKQQKFPFWGRNFECIITAETMVQPIEGDIESALQESIKLLDLDFLGMLDNTTGKRVRMLYVYLRYLKAAITHPAQAESIEKWFSKSNNIVKQLLHQSFGNHSFNKDARLNIWAIGIYMDRINVKIVRQGINENTN